MQIKTLFRPALLALGALLTLMPSEASANACSYATTGALKNSICWLDFAGYSEATATSAAGQPMSYTLVDGSTLTFTLKKSGTVAAKVVGVPSWSGAAFGTGQYNGIVGAPVFYGAAGGGTFTLTLSNIVVKDLSGTVRPFEMFAADGESTDGAESLSFGSNGGGWTVNQILQNGTNAVCNTASGVGTQTLLWKNTTGASGCSSGGIIASTTNPTAFSGTAVQGGLQGFIFGVALPSLKLNKIINGRAAANDQFSVSMGYTSPARTLSTVTSNGTATTIGTSALPVLSGSSVTLSEQMAAGSSSALSIYQSTINCTNANASSATALPDGNGTNFALTLALGDDITCTLTNTAPTTFALQKITSGGAGGPYSFNQTNLASVIPAITTAGSGTATPIVPTPIAIATVGSAITVTESNVAGIAATAVNCTDANAASTGNSGTFGTLSASTLTVPAANVKYGAVITCVLTNSILPTLTLRETSLAGIGSFTFTGTNGWSSQTLATITTGVGVTGATQTLSAVGKSTVITETIPAGFTVSAITCTGLGAGGTYTPNLAAGTVTLDAAATAAGANIACTYTHSGADMSIDLPSLSKTASVGVPYSSTFACTNAASPAIAATAATCAISGLPASLTTTCSPTVPTATPLAPGGVITCTVAGTPTTPVASLALNGTTGATNEVNSSNNTSSTTLAITGADMKPDLTGLPATATVGTLYSGTVLCTNGASATAAAINPTCAISNLPLGLTVGTCTPPLPVTLLAAGASISCPVSGTPTTPGFVTASVSSTATNDTTTANDKATKVIATVGSDMAPDLSGLPTSLTVGVAYTGTIKCTNVASATAPATNATCSVSTLPAGLTLGACTPPTPVASLAAGQSISCAVAGTPTSNAPTPVTVATGADNDSNGGTTTGGNNQATATLTPSSSDMSIDLSTLTANASIGVAYSSTFKCTNAASPAAVAISAGCAVTGLPAGLTQSCSPAVPTAAPLAAGASITCTVSGTPTAVGNATINASTGASNDLNPANNTASATLAVTGSDVSPDLSGLPATATVGTPYSGTVLCTNSASTTAAATGVSCNITGLPPGVTLGACTPATPAASLAIGASISCAVSGTPTAQGTTTASVTTTATNDPNPANDIATKAIATVGSDMVPDLSGLPTTISVGVPYTGTIKCTNSSTATAPAANATCSVSALPAGLTLGACTPTPPTTLAANASISCAVTGTPTSSASTVVTVTTGADNDINGGTTTSGNNQQSATLAPTSSDMSINLAGLPATANIGVPYNGTFTCTNAAAPAVAATAASCAVTGLPAGLSQSCSPTVPAASVAPGAVITCTVSGTPTALGNAPISGTTGASNAVNLANNIATAAINVIGADVSPDLTGLPATATVGVPYSGTIKCTNSMSATAAGLAVSCNVTGLPPGVTVGACTPTTPVASLPSGASISCPVTGTPTTTGTTTASVSTGATNDTNPANDTATKPIATSSSDMSISLAGLPATASIGVPYSGSYTCSNAAAPAIAATNATCAVSGLPAGLTTVCSPTVPAASLAPGATITCTVSGTPTAVGNATLNGTTSASNEENLANNTATAAINVTGSDMTPDLSGLPGTITVGVPYTGTILCTNNAAATASATNASCTVGALPAGLTLGACTPTPPATIAAGASISCPVTGTPTSTTPVAVAVTTGATNDVNGGTTNTGNNSASKTLSPNAAALSISLSGLPVTGIIGVPYSGSYTCANGPAPAATATGVTCNVPSLPAGLTAVCAPTTPATLAPGASITCTVTGTPTTVANYPLTGTAASINDPVGSTATTAVNITGSDIAPDLSGLPATATVGVPYSGTVLCTNSTTATGAALNVSCAVTGLPPGVTVGTCSPTLPAASLAIGVSISCPVSGIPTSPATTTASVATGATNDTNGGLTTGGNNTATKPIATVASDMVPDLSGLPATLAVGVPYSGAIKCTNSGSATASATNASCAVSGLPAGLVLGACSPAPPATVAPGSSISCPVTGTPTTAASSAVVVTTGATNDSNGGTSNGGNNSATATLAPASSDMSISLAGLPPTASIGVPYSGTFTCSNAAAAAIAATNASCAVSGLPAGLTTVCSPTVPAASVAPGAAITCTVSGTPTAVGSASLAGTTGATNDVNLANNTATAAINVTGADVSPDLTGLPAVATVGVPYTGTVKCTNSTTATAAGLNVSCVVIGLPPGVTVGPCTPTTPVASLAIGASISCPVTGTPTAPGTTTASVTTGATNDTNPANDTATKPITTNSSDMAISLTGLPTTANVGMPYSGTFKCSNAAAPAIAATNASCAVTGLLAGLTTVCSPTVPAASVAPGAAITCTVSGTPTAAGNATLSGSTGAVNDSNPANNNATAVLAVLGSDMAPDLSGLPTLASVGVPYTGVIKCTNNAVATGSALAASCTITGLPPGVTLGTCAPAAPATIAPGASISCPVSGTPTASGNSSVSVVTGATNDTNGGTGPGGNNTATATIAASSSDMAIDLSGLPATAGVGQPYTGTFKCTAAAAPFVAATSPTCAVAGLPAGLTTTCVPSAPSTLAPGSSILCTVSGTPTAIGSSTLTGTTGATNDVVVANNTATAPLAVVAPGLAVAKSSTVTTFTTVGAIIPYSYKVTNTGPVAIFAAVTISDNKIPTVSCPALGTAGLAAGASITCMANYAVTQADLDAGSVTNSATATSGTTTSPAVSLTITATKSPALSVVKTSANKAFSAIGDVLTYSYKVTNTGNVTATSAVTVTDDKIPAVTCPALPSGGLAPAAFITCSGTSAVTQADLDAGAVTNVAQAKSGSTSSPTVSLTITGKQTPDFKIGIITLNSNAIATNNGDGTFTTNYELKLTNTGNVALKNVHLLDDYAAQLPKRVKLKATKITTVVSSKRGNLTSANPLFTGSSVSPEMLAGNGESLDVGEVITIRFDVVFDPGSVPASADFTNTVTGQTNFGSGTAVTAAVRTSAAPIVFVANPPMIVSKVSPKTDITRGDLVPYTITVRSGGDVSRSGLTLVDNMPAGFKYRVTSATVDGIAREPIVSGRTLSWPDITVSPTKPVVLKLVLIAGAGIGSGEFTNEAWMTDASGSVLSSVGRATVRMIGDPTFDCTDIIGRVFEDKSGTGSMDDGARGVANVRLATVRGQLITTDSEGRYHIACADIPESERGTNFILKLDERTLPTGYRVTTENPRVIRITAGKMAKINFGVSQSHMARLDLTDAAFETGTTRLKRQWAAGMQQVIEALKKDRAVLRIAYRRHFKEDATTAEARVKSAADAFTKLWAEGGAPYPLSVEIEIFAERAAR
jgi:uncharacterized repeat protein (TIGR01451 family)